MESEELIDANSKRSRRYSKKPNRWHQSPGILGTLYCYHQHQRALSERASFPNPITVKVRFFCGYFCTAGTNRKTDRQTNNASYRDKWMHLKSYQWVSGCIGFAISATPRLHPDSDLPNRSSMDLLQRLWYPIPLPSTYGKKGFELKLSILCRYNTSTGGR